MANIKVHESKQISEGGEARIDTWFDPNHQRELFQVVVESPGLRIKVTDSIANWTEGNARRVFDAIGPDDTWKSVLDRWDELNAS